MNWHSHTINYYLVFILSMGKEIFSSSFGEYDYNIVHGLQHRLVGGTEVTQNKLPFLAAFTFNRQKNSDPKKQVLTCTASLISRRWLISASHCLGKKSGLNVKHCIKGSRCEKTDKDDFVFYPDSNKSWIRIGVGNFIKELDTSTPYEVDKIIRPRDAYPSGGYGDYGGYDVILIKLKEAVNSTDAKPICLPSEKFSDVSIKAVIAGYGKYRRPTCQVNSQGPSKVRYCGFEKECQTKGTKFKKALCEVSFPYQGRILRGCQKNIPSPSASNKLCKSFLEKNSDEFKSWPDNDEFELYENKTLKLLTRCYRSMDDSNNGWCGVNLVDDMSKPVFKITSDSGWGFCSQECFPDPKQPFYGVAREKVIDILDEDYCENLLTNNGKLEFKVKPEVLCVGFNKSFDFRIYSKDGSGHFTPVMENDPRFKKIYRREQTWYVVGPGSCHGDSGGPVFTSFDNGTSIIRVLLGVTSSGTSKIGNCGGIDNPTHYTRLKKMFDFITEYVDDKKHLCFSDGKNDDEHSKKPQSETTEMDKPKTNIKEDFESHPNTEDQQMDNREDKQMDNNKDKELNYRKDNKEPLDNKEENQLDIKKDNQLDNKKDKDVELSKSNDSQLDKYKDKELDNNKDEKKMETRKDKQLDNNRLDELINDKDKQLDKSKDKHVRKREGKQETPKIDNIKDIQLDSGDNNNLPSNLDKLEGQSDLAKDIIRQDHKSSNRDDKQLDIRENKQLDNREDKKLDKNSREENSIEQKYNNFEIKQLVNNNEKRNSQLDNRADIGQNSKDDKRRNSNEDKRQKINEDKRHNSYEDKRRNTNEDKGQNNNEDKIQNMNEDKRQNSNEDKRRNTNEDKGQNNNEVKGQNNNEDKRQNINEDKRQNSNEDKRRNTNEDKGQNNNEDKRQNINEDKRHNSNEDKRRNTNEDKGQSNNEDKRQNINKDKRQNSNEDKRHSSKEDKRHNSKEEKRHNSKENKRQYSNEDKRHNRKDNKRDDNKQSNSKVEVKTNECSGEDCNTEQNQSRNKKLSFRRIFRDLYD